MQFICVMFETVVCKSCVYELCEVWIRMYVTGRGAQSSRHHSILHAFVPAGRASIKSFQLAPRPHYRPPLRI